jgi:hypothetical protein
MELVDMLDLGSSASRRGSSSLPARTHKKPLGNRRFFYAIQLFSTWGDEKFILSAVEVSLPARTHKKPLGNRRFFYAIQLFSTWGDEKFILSAVEVSLPARTHKKPLGNRGFFYAIQLFSTWGDEKTVLCNSKGVSSPRSGQHKKLWSN